MEFDVDTRNVTVLFVHTGSEVNAMDYDYRNRYVYFPRYSRHDIMRFKYPSENRILETVIHTQRPVCIAIDSVNGHLYWIKYQEDNTLSRSDLDGTNVHVVSTPLRDTFALRLDLSRRWLYMVDRSSGISKSRYNLSENKTIVNFHPQRVDCIDIDVMENKVYWIDGSGNLTSVKDDGSNVEKIISTNVSTSYYAISVFGRVIYYAGYNKLFVINKTQGSSPISLYSVSSRIGSIFVFNRSGILTTMFSDLLLNKFISYIKVKGKGNVLQLQLSEHFSYDLNYKTNRSRIMLRM
ncbi:Hypothetical predicted protein [Mytilus galloprovincialis]|nr:Hypothetical predicted protein [Mytilus galloprovincialis]